MLKTLVMAAVRVVLPWSTWPMVPTFRCGFVLSNRPLDKVVFPFCFSLDGESSGGRTRTADPLLTMEVLYLLSYRSIFCCVGAGGFEPP